MSSPGLRRLSRQLPTGRHACSSAGSSPLMSTGIGSPTRDGNGSRIGRTITAPAADDPRPVNFAFVSCQDVNEGKLNAYRRMIFEDERAEPEDQLGFVLHLGDFIYEVVEYPEEVKTRYDRTIYEVARIPDGRQGRPFPLSADGRRLSRRLQRLSRGPRPAGRARALAVRRHLGQSRILLAGLAEHSCRPAAVRSRARASRSPPTRRGSNISRRVARRPSGLAANISEPPAVENVAIEKWDENGLGDRAE